MALTANDLVLYGSANMPKSNGNTVGGVIDTTTKITFTDIAADDTVDLVSSLAEDTSKDVTVVGRTSTGTMASGTVTLTGTSDVLVNVQFERIMEVVSHNGHHGTVTVKRTTDDATIGTLESGINTLRRPFFNVSSASSGAADYYEKGFFKNNSITNALLAGSVSEVSDTLESGTNGDITFALSNGQNDGETISNRLNTAPSAVTSFNDTTKNIPGINLLPGSGVGVWFKMSLESGQSPGKYVATYRLNGSTT